MMQQVWPTPGVVDDTMLRALYRLPVRDTPYLRTNFVSTLDGSAQGPDGRSGTINTGTDQRLFALQRALCDAVLVGAGTVRVEGYRGLELDAAQRTSRAEAGLAGTPALVVVSRSLRVDPVLGPGSAGRVVLLTGAAGDARPLEDAGIEVVRCPGPGGVDLRKALPLLQRRGLARLLCEGGPMLHRQLLADGLVDEVCLTVVGEMVAGPGLRITNGPPLTAGFDLAHLLVDDDGTLFGRWLAHRD